MPKLRLTEWWRAGGKLVFQQNETDKTRKLYQAADPMRSGHRPGSIESPETTNDWSWASGNTLPDGADLLAAAVEIVVSCVTD